ncbi:PqqD family protein [Paenibacillus sp. KACC 21273]|uniref:PqqD family protein n=1 Tax=Paenibacillus sp. KACC 21273 TaxID=3025665 RepID=UPI0023671A9C|nr:PqqD family protein [Paenibacillus sp. KACC 21273]WDF50314.1 PqqD family protein [Paenibacillus sp. KACC 21273]
MKNKINKHLIVYEEDEEIILLNLVDNKFFALDFISSIFWKQINLEKENKEIVDYISKQFEVTKEQVQKDLEIFLRDLKKSGVIITE